MVSQVSQSGRVVHAVSHDHSVQLGIAIPPLTHEEASVLMTEEARRTLALLESLSGDDWDQPTACTRWNVRQLASHLVGESAGYASWREFYRQFVNIGNKRQYLSEKMGLLDAMNQLMVDDRADRTPDQLISELREAAPKAINTRQRIPALLRAVVMPLPALGTVRLDYLTDMIYPRDTWMHRVDIHRATNREITLDSVHDARIIALAIHDLALYLTPRLNGESIELVLDTPAGGTWHIGQNPIPATRIDLPLIEFMLLASGRIILQEAIPAAHIHGDHQLGIRTLEQTTIPF